MNLIKEAAKLIGWLTGALAGIVAILYACGYLIIQTQLHLLGIDALLPSGREYYLQEGANFFIVTGKKLERRALFCPYEEPVFWYSRQASMALASGGGAFAGDSVVFPSGV